MSRVTFIFILCGMLSFLKSSPQSLTPFKNPEYTYYHPSKDKEAWQRLNLLLSSTFIVVAKEGQVDHDTCLYLASRSLGLSRFAVLAEGFGAILKLAEEGKLNIEDPVHKFFPDAPETWKPIKIKHLMSHTSGLKREPPAYNNNIIQPDLVIIKSAYPLPLDFKTGEKFQYCNLAYFMLAEIITQVSKMPWQDYIRENLFKPAGMNHSTMTDFYPIIPNRASGYMHKGDTLVNADAMYAVRPSGGFLSTGNDMIRWDKALLEKNIILKKESWELLWKPYIKVSDKPESKMDYGFGWFIDEYNGHRLVMHDGSNTGFRSYYGRFVDDGLSIIIMTNTDEANPNAIGRALANYYFRNKR